MYAVDRPGVCVASRAHGSSAGEAGWAPRREGKASELRQRREGLSGRRCPTSEGSSSLRRHDDANIRAITPYVVLRSTTY